ncbi:MAG TPA: 4-phosphoerythronate dehydrogenase [Planctomycetota bacterium]|nr:4-phosphoerythronate dehydrogenase [Planctomycetota bacterium]
MLIIADNNIPYAAEAFGRFGEVRLVNGRSLTAEAVKEADILLVRSTVKVDEKLLGAASPRFVGTATIGTDHVDQAYLAKRGIVFASAPGSNAESVGEYWSAALLFLARRLGLELAGRTVGVVGVGNVGRRVVRRAKALGMDVVKCDPPLGRETKSDEYRPLGELLERADLVTVHVPLEKAGSDPTWHMADEGFFARMKPGAIFFNLARGPVNDSKALAAAIDSKKLSAVVLDTWEGEPVVDPKLAARADIATPHIAGHSFDGKVNGTQMLYAAVCRLLGEKEAWKPADSLPPPEVPRLTVEAAGRSVEDVCSEAVGALYDITADDARFRATMTRPEAERGKLFNDLRVNYPPRRAFSYTAVVAKGATAAQKGALTGLGFRVSAL